MSKERDIVLLQLGYGILVYAFIVGLFIEAERHLPECREYHHINNTCVEWEKTPGVSVIQSP